MPRVPHFKLQPAHLCQCSLLRLQCPYSPLFYHRRLSGTRVLPLARPVADKCQEALDRLLHPPSTQVDLLAGMRYFSSYEPTKARSSISGEYSEPFISLRTIAEKLSGESYERIEEFVDEMRGFWSNCFRAFRNHGDKAQYQSARGQEQHTRASEAAAQCCSSLVARCWWKLEPT